MEESERQHIIVQRQNHRQDVVGFETNILLPDFIDHNYGQNWIGQSQQNNTENHFKGISGAEYHENPNKAGAK